MSVLHALILSIIEGFTEFLPVSSTGHLILAARVLHLSSTTFVSTFEIAIQLGAILAVVVVYARKILTQRAIFLRVLAAFVPTAVIGFALYKLIKHLLFGNITVVLIALGLGGIALVAFESWYKEERATISNIAEISYVQCALIGLWQTLAIIPGVSRSAATIVGGLLMRIKRVTIVEFSFLLAIPTMAAATGLDLLKSYHDISRPDFGILGFGIVVTFLVALASITWLMKYIATHSFKAFGWYRIALSVAFAFYVFVLKK